MAWSDRRYSELRVALAERGLAFEAGAQPWERLLRALDPHDSGSVEVTQVIGLLLAEERVPSTPAAADGHPYPNLQSQLRGSACSCSGSAEEAPAGAARNAVVSRLAAAMATSVGAHRMLLRELRRADRTATGQCAHSALVECFSRAGQQLAAGQQSLLAVSVEDALALCAQSPTRATVAYQELLEDLDAAAQAQGGTAEATRPHRNAQTEPAAVPVVPGLPSERGSVSGCTGGNGDVVVSDLTGSRVRRPSQANRALAFEGAAGHRDPAFGLH